MSPLTVGHLAGAAQELNNKVAKAREGNSAEHYKGIIRKQKKEIQQLKHKLASYEKRAHRLDDIEEREQEFILESTAKENKLVESPNLCPGCGKGEIESISLGIKTIKRCNGCGARTIEKT